MRTRLLSLAAWAPLALASAPGCSSDHSALAVKPRTAGMGGAGGMAGAGGKGQGGAITKPDTAGKASVDPDEHVDTPGRAVYTIVNGVVDAPSVVWCFARL